MNYDKLKVALLKRYELTEEGFKRKYKKCRPENGETFQQFTTRMKSYFTRWIDMASIEKSYEGLQDLILREQLTFICNRDLELFLREREPKSLEQASKLADQYKEARYVDIVSLTYKNNERSRSRSNSESRSRSRSPISRGPNQGNQGYPRPRVRCYNCGGPHVRRFCPQLKQGIMKAGAVDYRRSRSPTRKVTFQTQEPEVPKEETAKDGNQNAEPKVCGACLILTDAVNYSQATTNEREMVKTSVGSPIKVSSVSSLSEMSTVQGFVGEKPVEVLRDTGCSGVIVSKDLVPESAYTGRSQTMVMVDYSSRVVPEVKVSIDTPYYKGKEGGLQQQQMNETSQVSMKKEDSTSMTSEGQGIMYSGTFMVKVGACQTFQEGECSTKCKDTLQEQMRVTSHVRKTVDDVTSANESNLQIEQNGNETLTERRPMGDGRRTGDMYEDGKVRVCNITDECRTSPDEFDRKDMIVWMLSFMAMMVMMTVSCIGKWTCTIGKIFRKGTECCSKRIRGWLLTGCFTECCRIGIVLLYMTDSLPIFKLSETVIQIMWTYVVMRDVVEGLSMISEVSDRWLRPGKRKFTVDLNGSIANHGKAIWRYVLKRSAERSKVSLREF